MKHLTIALAVFLLMGCQTTNTVPPKDTSPKIEPKVEKTQDKAEHQKQKPKNMPTVISTMKPLMCGDPSSTLEAITSVGEKPLAMWQDVQTGYNLILLYNKDKRSATLLEYIPGPYACFLSVGKDIHVEGVDFKRKKTGVSAERGLTKPLRDGINNVQFDDTD